MMLGKIEYESRSGADAHEARARQVVLTLFAAWTGDLEIGVIPG